VPTVQPIGRQRGILAPLLLLTLFSIAGCQSLATQSEGRVDPDTRWRITGQAGPVALRSPGQSFWQRAIPGVMIAPDSQIATFDGSRLELASAGDNVTVSGPSGFTLPTAEQNGVRVRQDAGSLRYKVRSAPKRHFEVKTPHFSAVVKGTSFLVSIDRTDSAVVVYEGRVLILDSNGQPLAELTAGQIGRMAGQPGATLEVSAAADPTFESAEPEAGREASAHGNVESPETMNETGASLAAPTNEPGAQGVEPSFFERIESFVVDLAAQLSSGGALTSGPVHPDNDRGGHVDASNLFDGSHGIEKGDGKGGRGGKGKGKGKRGRAHGNGNAKGKSESNHKGNDRGKGHSHGRGRGAGGGRAHTILDRDDQGHLIAWSERH
jgi:FecR protein